jgi:tripartite-type tricarboxylate transporter receptor subunit TctC
MGPAGTPPAVVAKIQRETATILGEPDVRKKLETLGIDLIVGGPDEFAGAIKAETPRWADLIKAAGIKALD